MTIYIVDNYANEPALQAYKTLDGAKLGLLEQYTKGCLPRMVDCIKGGESTNETLDSIQEDLHTILAHGFVEDFAYIHECELEE